MKKRNQILAITAAVTVLSASAAFAEYAPDQPQVDRGSSDLMTTAASTATDYVIVVNGVQLNQKGLLDGDKVMLPVRALAEALGFEVNWVGESETVQLIRGANFITFQIGTDGYTFAKTAPMPLGKAPALIGDLTYVPVNFADEILHTTVTVDPNGTVTITDTQEEEAAYNATLTSIEEDTLTVEDTEKGTVVLHIGEDTKLVGADGEAIEVADLEEGMYLNVEYSDVMTASLPPQNTPVSITVVETTGEPSENPSETPEVQTVTTSGTVLAVEEDRIVVGEDLEKPETQVVFNTDENTKFTKDGEAIELNGIKADDTVKVVHSLAMTRSLPPQTYAYEVEVVNAEEVENQTVAIAGTISEVGEDYIILGEENEAFRLNVNEDTEIKDQNGETVALADLKAGMTVDAERSLAATFSIPPQSYAYSMTVNTEAKAEDDSELPETVETTGTIAEVGEDRVTIGDAEDINAQTILLVSEETEILDKDGNTLTLEDLEKGMEIKVVHKNIMTMSIPPQTPAVQIVVQ